MRVTIPVLAAFLICSVGLLNAKETKKGGTNMEILSPSFQDKGVIPVKFTCEGDDVNPAFDIVRIPAGTKSLALIVDDPESPAGTWVHWVVFNIPVSNRIDENSVPGTQGVNDFGRNDYGGPCPPDREHRYFFKLYALDTMLKIPTGATKQELEKAMKGHILAEAELIGLYEKHKA